MANSQSKGYFLYRRQKAFLGIHSMSENATQLAELPR